jgi:hypothetical protein
MITQEVGTMTMQVAPEAISYSGDTGAITVLAYLKRIADVSAVPAVMIIREFIPADTVTACLRAPAGNPATPAVVLVGPDRGADTVTLYCSRATGNRMPRIIRALPHDARTRAAFFTTAAAVFWVCHQVGQYSVAGNRLKRRALG